MKNDRDNVPPLIRYQLWGQAAGRCEFRGCNKRLYRDGLTQTRSNLGKISHIVAAKPDGPRGDPVRSKLLEKDIRNLILACQDHGKIIGDPAYVADYPEALLLEFKQEHEQRVQLLTEAMEDAQTHVLLLQVPIDGRKVEINPTDAFRAILPRYRAEEQPITIDLNGIAVPTITAGFFEVASKSIEEELRHYLHGRRIRHLSVFALAPMPLLVYFGYLLGDINHVELYQRHRLSQDWIWQQGEEEAEAFFAVLHPEEIDDGVRPIAVLLSVSDTIPHAQVTAALGEEPLIYEIRANQPGYDFLRSHKQLEMFGYEARKLLIDL